MVYCREEFNPLLFAIQFGNLQIIRFFIEFMKVNAQLSLRLPIKRQDIGHKWHKEDSRCFALLVCIDAGHLHVFKYLLNHLSYLWQAVELQEVLVAISKISTDREDL